METWNDMAVHPEPFAYLIDGCTGSGMLGLAVKIALGGLGGDGGGISTILNIEREAYSAATLVARMEDTSLDLAPIWDVIEYAHRPPVVEYLRRFSDKPIIFTAGYPCQGFSNAGKRLGEEDERYIWPHIAEFIGKVRPDIVFLENVANHLALGFGRVRRDLETRGYRVTRGLFKASEVGANHERARLFILAMADGGGRRRNGIEKTEICPGGDASIAGGIPLGISQGFGKRAGFCPEGSPGIGERLFADTSAEMADTGHRQFQDQGRKSVRRTGPRSTGQKVGIPQCGQPIQPERCFREVGGWDRDSGKELADCGGIGCEGTKAFFERAEQSIINDSGEKIPIFAPGPGELDEWGRILGIDPNVKPAICRIPDGYATGMDACRLRITGNGVAPLQAAYAFVTLWAAIEYGGGF